MASITPFDPFTQSFTLLFADSTPFNVSLPALDQFVLYQVKICINYGAQLGASLVLMFVLLLLTKADKRTSPIFIINLLCLALNFIRNVLLCLYFTSPFSETYAFFGQDYSKVSRSDYAQSIASSALSLLLFILLEISLLLQVRVVCVTTRQKYKQAIFFISGIISLLAIGISLAFSVEMCRAVLSLSSPLSLNWLESAENITTTISICWFCLVFITKLGIALYEKRKLGIDRFGPMQIIFIMGCQTLIIPALFSILQYIVNVPELHSNVLTLVTIFLPLSSLWASATGPSSSPRPRHPSSRKNIKSFWSFGSGSASTGPLINDHIFSGPPSPASTAQRTSQSTVVGQGSGERDLEKQDLGG